MLSDSDHPDGNLQNSQPVLDRLAGQCLPELPSGTAFHGWQVGQLMKALSEGSVVQCLSHGTPYARHLSRCLLRQQLSFNAWRPRLSAMSGISCLASAQGASLDIICSAQQNHKMFEETHKLEDAISISRARGSWLCAFSHELDVCSA